METPFLTFSKIIFNSGTWFSVISRFSQKNFFRLMPIFLSFTKQAIRLFTTTNAKANQWTSFYMIGTFFKKELKPLTFFPKSLLGLYLFELLRVASSCTIHYRHEKHIRQKLWRKVFLIGTTILYVLMSHFVYDFN